MEIRINQNVEIGGLVFVRDSVVDVNAVPMLYRDEIMKYASPVWESLPPEKAVAPSGEKRKGK